MGLHWDGMLETIRESLSNACTGRLIIVSPYITSSALEEFACFFEGAEVTVLTSWKATNLIQTRSYLEVYPKCRDNGWELRILDSLHAKIYAVPPEEAWVGSANLTGRGMGILPNHNDEVMTRLKPSQTDWLSIENLVQTGTLVDDELFEFFSNWRDRQPNPETLEYEPLVLPERTEDGLTLSQFPRSSSVISLHDVLLGYNNPDDIQIYDAKHDLAVFDVRLVDDRDSFLASLVPRFFRIPIVRHALSKVGEDWSNFGKVRSEITDACGGRQAVDRDEVNRCTNVLYDWAQDLDESREHREFEFGKPRHTRLIRRTSVSGGLNGKQIAKILLSGFEKGEWYDRKTSIEIVENSGRLTEPDYKKNAGGEGEFQYFRRTSNALRDLLKSGHLQAREINTQKFEYSISE